ncbi:hypothetical protein [Psychrobacter sp. AOP7-A1-24]|uniref:hypothetical protein n=1 Tax=Psychrobacter sp. AOP7-A1-24 TaxID=3457646 RepID=UPI00402BCF6A
MNNSRTDEQYDLQKYLEEKAKQEQEKEKEKKKKEEQEPEQLSAYDACVLKESAKIHELIAEAQKRPKDE